MIVSRNLWAEIQRVTVRARETGALVSIETRCDVIRDVDTDFPVRILASLRRKGQASTTPTSGPRPDPFLPYEPALFVADLNATHVCLLNKFLVVDHHVLIVTRHFEHQESALTIDDFAAWIACLREFPSLGFYNGGPEAGASQPHKHMQVVPAPMGGPAAPLAPLDPWIRTARASAGDSLFEASDLRRDEPGVVPRFPFRHVVYRIDSWDAEQWHARYDSARQTLGLVANDDAPHRLPPYNLLVTSDWMLVVPRARECFAGISLNSLAFVGGFLVRDDEQLKLLREAGPWRALAEVGLPWESAVRTGFHPTEKRLYR